MNHERKPMKKFTLSLILTAFFIVPGLPGTETDTPVKKIFAHYMGCFPPGYGALSWHLNNARKTMDYESDDYRKAIGGYLFNWPLLPQNAFYPTPEQSAELEIRRAIRAGIDGFAVDAWAGSKGAPLVFDTLIRTAERMKVPFEITICMDPGCHPQNPLEPGNNAAEFAKSVNYILRHKNSPNLARRNGKILIFGYYSSGVKTTKRIKTLPESPEKWKHYAEGWREVERLAGTPLFIHYSIDSMRRKNPAFRDYVLWASKHFDAVGAFLNGDFSGDRELPRLIRANGAEWSQPMLFQYNNKRGGTPGQEGLKTLRSCWEAAIANNSTLIQFVTWNDYGEDTSLAPGYTTGYTVPRITRHYAEKWKTGRETVLSKDELHLVYYRQTADAEVFPFQGRPRKSPGILEVVSLLKTPGTVEVPGYGRFPAPAGIHFHRFPLKKGKISARLLRGTPESAVLEVNAPEEVTDRPWREDHSMVCFGSNFQEEWQADFGSRPPLLYSENGDADSDGLPNWFEMFYFGHFPFMETATAANPDADPDSDGRTNLREYLEQSDPLKPDREYKTGEKWRISDLLRRKLVFLPGRDQCRHPVWYGFYRFGSGGPFRPFSDGSAIRRQYDSPLKHEKYGYGESLFFEKHAIRLGIRPQLTTLIGWRAPVTGPVSASAAFHSGNGTGTVSAALFLNGCRLSGIELEANRKGRLNIPEIQVKKGDFLYFIPGRENGRFRCLYLDEMEIVWKNKEERNHAGKM